MTPPWFFQDFCPQYQRMVTGPSTPAPMRNPWPWWPLRPHAYASFSVVWGFFLFSSCSWLWGSSYGSLWTLYLRINGPNSAFLSTRLKASCGHTTILTPPQPCQIPRYHFVMKRLRWIILLSLLCTFLWYLKVYVPWDLYVSVLGCTLKLNVELTPFSRPLGTVASLNTLLTQDVLNVFKWINVVQQCCLRCWYIFIWHLECICDENQSSEYIVICSYNDHSL